MGTVIFVFISGACGFLARACGTVLEYPSTDAQDLNRLQYLVTRATGEHVRFHGRVFDATSSKGMETVGWFLGSGTKIIPWYASRTQSLSERLPICVNRSEIVTGPDTCATRISGSSLPRVEHESLV